MYSLLVKCKHTNTYLKKNLYSLKVKVKDKLHVNKKRLRFFVKRIHVYPNSITNQSERQEGPKGPRSLT